jgi:hypothetical protein
MLLSLRRELNRKEIEESTGLYMNAETGTKKELYWQALSADDQGSLRGCATRRLLPVPGEPNQSFERGAGSNMTT